MMLIPGSRRGRPKTDSGEVEALLNLPNTLVLIRRKDLCWIADRDPADGHYCVRWYPGVDVYNALEPDLRP